MINDKIDYDLLTPYEKLPYGCKIFNSSQLGQGTPFIFQNRNKWNGREINTINSGQNPVIQDQCCLVAWESKWETVPVRVRC